MTYTWRGTPRRTPAAPPPPAPAVWCVCSIHSVVNGTPWAYSRTLGWHNPLEHVTTVGMR